MPRIYELLAERENGDRDTLHLCAECFKTIDDFARVLKRRKSNARCDRCSATEEVRQTAQHRSTLRALTFIASQEKSHQGRNEQRAARGLPFDVWQQPGAFGRTRELPWPLVKRLSEAGLIERVPSTGNGWNCIWRCSDAGRALLDEEIERAAAAGEGLTWIPEAPDRGPTITDSPTAMGGMVRVCVMEGKPEPVPCDGPAVELVR